MPSSACDEHAEEPVRRARVAEDALHLERATRRVGRVLEQQRVAGHQGGGRRPHDLPEGKVPRHDREHDAQRPEGDVAARCVRRRVLRRQHLGAVVGEVVECPRALLDLGARLDDRFAHLANRGHRERVALRAQARGAPHATARRDRRATPRSSRATRVRRRRLAPRSATGPSAGFARARARSPDRSSRS